MTNTQKQLNQKRLAKLLEQPALRSSTLRRMGGKPKGTQAEEQ